MPEDTGIQLGDDLFTDGKIDSIADSTEVETIAPTVIEKVKVGDSEYTQDELNRFVGLGKLASEAETKYNTKIDRVYQEFTKSRQEIKDLQEKYETALKNSTNPISPEDKARSIKEAQQAARELGIPTMEDLDAFYERKRAAEKLLDAATSMENEIDGSDGRPKFEKMKVMQYMIDNGVNDMKTAYKIMNEEALDVWKETQLGKNKKPGITNPKVVSAGGGKQPTDVKVTKDNLSELVSQALEGGF